MNVDILVSIGSGAVAFLIGWGMMRAKVIDLERRIGIVEENIGQQNDLVHSLRDVYVSYQHFNEIMQAMRETHRDLREDLKKILDLLSVR